MTSIATLENLYSNAKATGRTRFALPDAPTAKTDRKDKLFVVTAKGDRLPRLYAEGEGYTIDGKANHVGVEYMRERRRQVEASAPAVVRADMQFARDMGNQAYVDAILALPELHQGNLRHAMKIAASYDEKSMPLHRVAATLRGLPEDRPLAHANEPTQPAVDEKKLKRLVEVSVATLAKTLDHRDADAKSHHTNLAYSLSLATDTGMQMSKALAAIGIDVAPFAAIINEAKEHAQ